MNEATFSWAVLGVLRQVMEVEVAALTGAGRGEPTPERSNQERSLGLVRVAGVREGDVSEAIGST